MRTQILFFAFIILPYIKGLAQQIETLQVYSSAMNKHIKTIVVNPSEEKNLPVVYILHGYSGYPERTLKKDIPALEELSLRYKMIFVIPDGNYDSWYLNSPIGNSKYETFITIELVKYINNKYNTQNSQKAIIGWSMGGHGALYLGARHPLLFSAIGSISGAINFTPYGEDYGVTKILGDDKKKWKNYTAISQIGKLKHSQQKILISCGFGDPFIKQNRILHHKLLDLDIPHIYEESPGEHDADYWSVAAKTQLYLLNQFFESHE